MPGAMAAMCAAYRMKVPALAARAPLGATNDGHRHRRGEDRLDDLAHRGIEPAGRVHAQDDELGALLRRALDAALAKSALAGPMAPSSGTTTTGAADATAQAHPTPR